MYNILWITPGNLKNINIRFQMKYQDNTITPSSTLNYIKILRFLMSPNTKLPIKKIVSFKER